MEINITEFFTTAAPMDYSASAMELGNNAGAITWQAAKDDAPDYNLLDSEEKREAFREHVKGFGAWDDEEITEWSDDELNALFMQLISGDMREDGLDSPDPDWSAYEANEDSIGRIFKSDDDGSVYYYLGS